MLRILASLISRKREENMEQVTNLVIELWHSSPKRVLNENIKFVAKATLTVVLSETSYS